MCVKFSLWLLLIYLKLNTYKIDNKLNNILCAPTSEIEEMLQL